MARLFPGATTAADTLTHVAHGAAFAASSAHDGATPAALLVLIAVLVSLLAAAAAVFVARAAGTSRPLALSWAAATFATSLPLVFEVMDHLGA
ncbi:hypothetical protein [Streptomyces corynorhini]|uniref:Uncharacterized protein n=1 Tax=Streptomyces corynorhini TaxID=2282652 RepID=A0A370BC94_9ACTN|nr:hypothetical protein [Streptomyces corynorhini]RDG39417.1 hypothetical protein DVH02_03750 [Streptomyces corynorhini]